MTKSTTRKQYAPEFKKEALRLANKAGVTKTARELGVYTVSNLLLAISYPKEGFHE